MLRLKAETFPALIPPAAFAAEFAVQKITRVKLGAGLGSPNFQGSTARRFLDDGSQSQGAGGMVQNPIMIIPGPELDLLVVAINPLANRQWLAKIQRGAPNRSQFPGGYQSAVDRRKSVGIDLDDVVEDVALGRQIEIGMMGQVAHRLFIGGGGKFQLERIVFRNRVDRRDGKIAGKAFFAVATGILQLQGGTVCGG